MSETPTSTPPQSTPPAGQPCTEGPCGTCFTDYAPTMPLAQMMCTLTEGHAGLHYCHQEHVFRDPEEPDKVHMVYG